MYVKQLGRELRAGDLLAIEEVGYLLEVVREVARNHQATTYNCKFLENGANVEIVVPKYNTSYCIYGLIYIFTEAEAFERRLALLK